MDGQRVHNVGPLPGVIELAREKGGCRKSKVSEKKVGVSKIFSRYMYNCVKECILI